MTNPLRLALALAAAALCVVATGCGSASQQVTDDLASFWSGAYHEVKKELRRRYPRHAWPEDPTVAEPTRGVRRSTPRT